MFLICDYMEKGSLFSILFDDAEAMEYLDWRKRVNMVKGTALGLSYRHQRLHPPIVQRDVLANNVFN
uniref:non-specific serine/threonine protein kinase n=1 Tax=Cajanus cajan TaxID=3821 RepID=A0A151UID2_CAJCA